MNNELEFNTNQVQLDAIAKLVHDYERNAAGDVRALLNLLRLLEQLHRDLREGSFQTSLPNNRQELYALLRSIEANGGWPYIPRMKLKFLCSHVLAEETHHAPPSK